MGEGNDRPLTVITGDRKTRVTWRDHFVCSRDICFLGKTVVMPAGGVQVVSRVRCPWSLR